MLTIERLHIRAAFFRCIRSFFFDRGFLEVDTPLRQPVLIPESNIIPLASEGQYLQTSPELCMKRLLAQGCDKIFQISHCFRKGELGRLHLEEFQLLEWYRTDCDYRHLMTDCQDLLRFLVAGLKAYIVASGISSTPFFFADIDLDAPWQRITVTEAFARLSPVSLEVALDNGKFDEILTEFVEPQLGLKVPAFLYDYPCRLASLARKSPADPAVAERFELYIQGVEIANGFSELTDPDEQRTRFEKEIAEIEENTGRKAIMPVRFLEDLGRLQEAAGIALGLDRLFMLAVNAGSVGAAVTFSPTDL